MHCNMSRPGLETRMKRLRDVIITAVRNGHIGAVEAAAEKMKVFEEKHKLTSGNLLDFCDSPEKQV